MELEEKIARLATKIDRWEAKVDRVEQALAEGTAYLGTTDHGELMAILQSRMAILGSLNKQNEQLQEEKSAISRCREESVSPLQLGSAAGGGARQIAAAPKTAAGARGQHPHQQPTSCLPAPPPQQSRRQDQKNQPPPPPPPPSPLPLPLQQHQQHQHQHQLVRMRRPKHHETPEQEQLKRESEPISQPAPPSVKPHFAGWSLDTQPPPSPPKPLAPSVDSPASGGRAAEAQSFLGNQEPQQGPTVPEARSPLGNQEPRQQEPSARPDPASPQTAPSAMPGRAELPRDAQAPPSPPGAPARHLEAPEPGDRAAERHDSPRYFGPQQQVLVPRSNIESTDTDGGSEGLPKVQSSGTHLGGATPAAAARVETASEGAAAGADASAREGTAGNADAPAWGRAAGGVSGESSQPAGQKDKPGHEGVGVLPATEKTIESLDGYAGEASSAALAEAYVGTPAADGQLEVNGYVGEASSKAPAEEFAGTPAADGQLEGHIQIFFKSPQVCGDKTMTLDVFPHDTVEDIKLKIQTKEGTPVDFQRLIYNCRHLEDHLTVAQCNIQRGSTIHSFLSWSVPELSLDRG